MFLIHPNIKDIEEGLESWSWLDFAGKEPIAVTAFGDVFFEARDGIYFLDRVSGELSLVCDTKNNLEKVLNTPDGRNHYLMSELVLLARERGLVLDEGECYEFKITPILGGALDLDNLHKMDFKISLHITGQLIGQVKNLPIGTRISEVKFEDS